MVEKKAHHHRIIEQNRGKQRCVASRGIDAVDVQAMCNEQLGNAVLLLLICALEYEPEASSAGQFCCILVKIPVVDKVVFAKSPGNVNSALPRTAQDQCFRGHDIQVADHQPGQQYTNDQYCRCHQAFHLDYPQTFN